MPRIALIAALATLALAPSALAVPPIVNSITVTPTSPTVGEPASVSVDVTWGGTPGEVRWNFGDLSLPVTTMTTTESHTYESHGLRTIEITATNGEGEASAPLPKGIRVNRRPVAAFTFSPDAPVAGDDILFASNSTDPDGDGLIHRWSFGGDVTSPLPSPVHTYSSPGIKTVTLTVTDSAGAEDSVSREVSVQGPPVPGPKVNILPIANFAFGPRSPRVGDPVEFASSAVDPDGELRAQTWDLDGDGEFDDARGDEVIYTYLTPGEKPVRLRVDDNSGSAAIRQRSVTVRPAPTRPPGFLRPWPNIRFNGTILSAGTRVKILSVRAPRGALVRVGCRGKGCPVKQRRKRIKKGSVRFRNFERFLRAGVRLEIYIRKPGVIGRYKQYTIRAGTGPRAVDRCLKPGKKRPVRC